MGVPWDVKLPEMTDGDRASWVRCYTPDGHLYAVIDPADPKKERKPVTESHRISLRPAVKAGR